MHYERITGKFALNSIQYVNGQLWCGLKFVGSVAGSDSDSQRIAACLFDKLDYLVRIGQMLVNIIC